MTFQLFNTFPNFWVVGVRRFMNYNLTEYYSKFFRVVEHYRTEFILLHILLNTLFIPGPLQFGRSSKYPFETTSANRRTSFVDQKQFFHHQKRCFCRFKASAEASFGWQQHIHHQTVRLPRSTKTERTVNTANSFNHST